MALTERDLDGLDRQYAELDKRLPMAPTMDGRLPMHQDVRRLLAEVRRLRAGLEQMAESGDWWVQARVDEVLSGDD